LISDSEPSESPTIFEDFQNPLQTSLAIGYYNYKKEGDTRMKPIFNAAEKHSKVLSKVQE